MFLVDEDKKKALKLGLLDSIWNRKSKREKKKKEWDTINGEKYTQTLWLLKELNGKLNKLESDLINQSLGERKFILKEDVKSQRYNQISQKIHYEISQNKYKISFNHKSESITAKIKFIFDENLKTSPYAIQAADSEPSEK